MRLSLLVKIRQFSIAMLEATPFAADNPDLYFEWSPELHGGRQGSMVPFHMRLLIARLPQLLGRYRETLEKLYQIKTTIGTILHNLSEGKCENGSDTDLSSEIRASSIQLWKKRELETQYYIITCALGVKVSY